MIVGYSRQMKSVQAFSSQTRGRVTHDVTDFVDLSGKEKVSVLREETGVDKVVAL